MLNQATDELKVAASHGLSDEYLNKGPLSALHSIAKSLDDGPVAIADITRDPRLQYPEEAAKEGIASILSVPIQVNQKNLGALRVYTAEPWEFTIDDVNFVYALAQIAGMSIRLARYSKGLYASIEVLKVPLTFRTASHLNTVGRIRAGESVITLCFIVVLRTCISSNFITL